MNEDTASQERRARALWLNNFFHEISPAYQGVQGFSEEYFRKSRMTGGVVFRRGAFFMDDFENGYVTCRDGIRRTVGNPEHSESTIHFLGPSNVFSVFCSDEHTLPSYLRKLCSGHEYFKDFAVSNYGLTMGDFNHFLLQLKAIDIKEGDVVIMMTHCGSYSNFNSEDIWKYLRFFQTYSQGKGAEFGYFLRPEIQRIINPSERELIFVHNSYAQLISDMPRKTGSPKAEKYEQPHFISQAMALGCPCFDLQPFIERPHAGGEIFVDGTHYSPSGNMIIAKAIFDSFLVNLSNRKKDCSDILPNANALIKKIFIDKSRNNASINTWLTAVKNARPTWAISPEKIGGGIVVNANPFTNGHRFIIKTALDYVDYLYIFVVEEDRSDFAFQDRINMVALGTREFGEKVGVFPSGDFIISSFTFPEYFAKTRLMNAKVDTSNDLALFGSVIAPALNIKYRFVGEEPFCNVTRQYNEEMKKLLPGLGVNLVEIPRLEEGSLAVSASLVREKLASRQLAELKKLVPPTTWRYLLLNYLEPEIRHEQN